MQISLKETLTNMVEHLRDMTAQEVEDFVDSIGGSGDAIADVVIEQGVDGSGWTYRKWSSGRLDAERVRNIGTYTIGTVEVSPIRVGSNVTSALPSMAISGNIEVSLMGNTSNSAFFLEHIGDTVWRVAKVLSSGSVTLNNVTVLERTIGAKWK